MDDPEEGEILYNALIKDQLAFHAIRTVRGYQFFFKDNKVNKYFFQIIPPELSVLFN